jgi:hypothetical protein
MKLLLLNYKWVNTIHRVPRCRFPEAPLNLPEGKTLSISDILAPLTFRMLISLKVIFEKVSAFFVFLLTANKKDWL